MNLEEESNSRSLWQILLTEITLLISVQETPTLRRDLSYLFTNCLSRVPHHTIKVMYQCQEVEREMNTRLNSCNSTLSDNRKGKFLMKSKSFSRMVLYQDMPFQSETTTKTLIGASKPYDKASPYPPPYDVMIDDFNKAI